MTARQSTFFSAMLGASQTPAVTSGPDGLVLEANAAARALMGEAVAPGRLWPAPAARGWPSADLPGGARVWFAADERDGKAKNNFLLDASHEMRTPINGILGLVEILLDGELSPSQREHAKAVHEQTSALLHAISGMLDLARLDGARPDLDRTAFDPVSLMQSVAELLSPKAYENGMEIATIAGRDAPALVLGDEGRLRQILLALVGGVLRAPGAMGVVLSLRVTAREGANVKLRFDARAALDPVKSGAEAAPAMAGASIIERLADLMGGSTAETHEPGRGYNYAVELPFTCGEAKGAPYPDLDGLPVVIVTQSPVLSEAIAVTLARAGAAPVPASSADAARVELAGRDGVVLLDRAVAQTDHRKYLALGAPVILMAPQEARGDIAQYMAAGFAGFLVKPLRRRSLIERVALAAKRDGRTPPPLRQAPKRDLADERETHTQVRAHILLAEDNPINAKIATAMLTAEGHSVRWTEDGEAALAALLEETFDVIILDMRMPKLDGRATARAIRAMGGAYATMPILALTAEAFVEDAANAMAAGVSEVLSKPVDRQVLAATVARWVTRARQKAAVQSH